MRAALENVKLVKGAILPKAPVKVTFPAVPAAKAKSNAPLRVLEKLIVAPAGVPPPFVLSKIVGVV